LDALAGFAVRLLLELHFASSLPVGGGYKPSSYRYARRGWREVEGVYSKGVRLSRSVRIVSVDFHDGVGEVEAIVPSESGGRSYKVRVSLPLDFECTCPWGSTRFNPCKHVYATVLKVLGDVGVDVEDWVVELLVYEGLNRVAYHKATVSKSIA